MNEHRSDAAPAGPDAAEERSAGQAISGAPSEPATCPDAATVRQ